ncbi:hypothetical protein D3800_11790 [Microcystis aeruginosa NIES-298]|uniref:Uncharacterized protein n=1 Tax=Microcystis aeruginosa NIES-298 TaxID=449468 RepID=A0A2H6BNR0_MICAE|nr:COP23 domain-containing protein [Microcystis aeruginosa]QHU83951.1 hypothetical protein D3800_11790 [Microcystis aeruginosa NIES-298]GBD51819.1 hypothetical protein BGM30_09120 [Microcystis aeruginosa NIES-298]GBE97216.1 hypothetical protein NIES298_14650 [Microcystis aeruginosa NIES-298]
MSDNKNNVGASVVAILTVAAGILTAAAPFIVAVTGLISVLKPSPDPSPKAEPQKTNVSPRQVPSESQPSKVTFSCGESKYNGKSFPATIATGDKSIPIILWKLDNNYFGDNWPPLKRCEEVSRRFQRIYDRDGLKRSRLVATLETWVPNKEVPVICAVKSENSVCHEEDLLITLESKDNPDDVLKELLNRHELPSQEPPPFRDGEKPPKTFAEGKRVFYDISSIIPSPKSKKNTEKSSEKPAW